MSSNLDTFFHHSYCVSLSIMLNTKFFFLSFTLLLFGSSSITLKGAEKGERSVHKENNNTNNNKEKLYTNPDYHRNMFRTINLLACNIIKKLSVIE